MQLYVRKAFRVATVKPEWPEIANEFGIEPRAA